MKTKGLMFIALFISGAAFAQSATVKQEQQVKVESNTEVKTAGGSGHAMAAANNSSEISTRSAMSENQVNAEAGAAYNQGSAVTVDPSAVARVTGTVKGRAESGLETAAATGRQLEKQTMRAGKAATQHVNNVTAATHNAVRANGTLSNSMRIKAAPVKVNTLTSGAVGLRGL
jgi:hypothetical protein